MSTKPRTKPITNKERLHWLANCKSIVWREYKRGGAGWTITTPRGTYTGPGTLIELIDEVIRNESKQPTT